MSKHDSVHAIFYVHMSALLHLAQLTVPKIAEDSDIEYLHQYRVTLRHARALLTVFCDVLPETLLLAMTAEIKALFCATGQLRDLDILLNRLHQVKPKHKSAYTALIKAISVKRQHEFAQFLAASQSREFRARFVHLQACLSKIGQSSCQVNLHNCWPAMIRKSMEDVHSAYKKLWKKNNNAHIHKLRKKLKQLRYCIELLGVLVKPRKAKKLLSWLKRQQESLGSYNDLIVQCNLLKDHPETQDKIQRVLHGGERAQLKKRLPLAKSDWTILRQKLQPMLG